MRTLSRQRSKKSPGSWICARQRAAAFDARGPVRDTHGSKCPRSSPQIRCIARAGDSAAAAASGFGGGEGEEEAAAVIFPFSLFSPFKTFLLDGGAAFFTGRLRISSPVDTCFFTGEELFTGAGFCTGPTAIR